MKRSLTPVRAWTLGVLLVGLPAAAWAQSPVAAGMLTVSVVEGGRAEAPPAPLPHLPGSIAGVVMDVSEAAVPDAVVTLEAERTGQTLTVQSGGDGAFVFPFVQPGEYKVHVATPGFQAWSGSADVQGGERLELPGIALAMAGMTSVVTVRASEHEVAEAQLGLEEKQRVLGIFPNFYASYAPDAAPLSAGEKYRLAWRFARDPEAFGMAGVVAAAEQEENAFSGYGRGAGGYGKRFGAAYTDGFTSTMLGQALLPAVFHQDPRYFVKGTGSVSARTVYALASTVMCKGDSKRWQVNYSNLLGNVASAGISNAYYPAANRGAGLVMENALTATALGAVGGLFQEFVLHRMTPHVPDYGAVR